MTHDELENVLSHEITHIQKDHVFKGYAFWLKAMVPAYCVAVLLVRIIDFKIGGINIKLSSTPNPMFAGLTSIGLAYTLAYLPSTWYERKSEKEADLGAVDLTGNKQLVQALEKHETWQKKYAPCSYRLLEAMPWLFNHPSNTQRKKYIQEYTPQPVAV